MEKEVSYLSYFSSSFDKITFDTEIFDSKSWTVDFFSAAQITKKWNT